METRPPVIRLHEEMIVDNFAGGGGASLGIEMALGRSPDIAVNHDPEAIAMHAVNHPTTRHLCGDVWDVDPKQVCGGRRVALAWFSPDCKHFSKAKGGKPVEKKVRGLAWVVVRWAKAVRPRVIILENVEEFETWGPLLEDGRPDPMRRGLTFRRWVGQLEASGYVLEMRLLRACDYGAPTSRKRLFIIARCDGQPIVWPGATHSPGSYRTAAECIQWEIPTTSIFGRDKPLATNTLRRIGRGVWRHVIGEAEPFIVPVTHAGDARVHGIREPIRTVTSAHRGELAYVAPTLIQTGYGERPGQAPRVPGLHKPLGTIIAGGGGNGNGKHALVEALLARYREDGESSTRLPNRDEVHAFLVKYYGTAEGQSVALPMGTVTTRDRFGLVRVRGLDYEIADIGMRMLAPRELFRAQGFPDTYRIEIEYGGKILSKGAQVRMCGNSVSPVVARALVLANVAQSSVVAA